MGPSKQNNIGSMQKVRCIHSADKKHCELLNLAVKFPMLHMCLLANKRLKEHKHCWTKLGNAPKLCLLVGMIRMQPCCVCWPLFIECQPLVELWAMQLNANKCSCTQPNQGRTRKRLCMCMDRLKTKECSTKRTKCLPVCSPNNQFSDMTEFQAPATTFFTQFSSIFQWVEKIGLGTRTINGKSNWTFLNWSCSHVDSFC